MVLPYMDCYVSIASPLANTLRISVHGGTDCRPSGDPEREGEKRKAEIAPAGNYATRLTACASNGEIN
jgi:hypothetical protein